MILIDFSAIQYQNLFGVISGLGIEPKENGKYEPEEFMPAFLGCLLQTIIEVDNTYRYEFGDIVLCLDNVKEGLWRKQYLKSYKETRKANREESPVPFDAVFPKIEEFLEQIRKNTPYKIVSVSKSEGDDAILCLAKAFSKTEKILIYSSDKDMIQAQKYGNVTQFSPLMKKFLTAESKAGSMNEWLLEHCILGDPADEVPKITDFTEFSDNFKAYLSGKNLNITPKEYLELPEETIEDLESNYSVMKKSGKTEKKDIWKQMKLGPATLKKIIDSGKFQEFLDSNPLYRPNLERNKRLVLAEYIPQEIYDECVKQVLENKKITYSNIDDFKNYLVNLGLSAMSELVNFDLGKASLDDFL